MRDLEPILRLLQACSGLGFSVFSLLHVGGSQFIKLGHFLSNFSIKLGNKALFTNRGLVQSRPFEVGIVVGCILVHATCSWALVYKRGALAAFPDRKVIIPRNIHRWSGYVYIVK